jgi:diguanylate cyclase (GGDEF)-like protein/PAS domain S-box-containing protein
MRHLPQSADPERGNEGCAAVGDQQLRLALQLANLSTWSWNLETGELDWSRDLEAQNGLVPASFGRTLESFLDVVHPDDTAMVRETLTRAAETETGFEIEFRIVLPDGSIRRRTAAGDVLRDAAGRATHLNGVGRDMTERQAAEEAGERLRQVEERYRTLVEQLPLASYLEGLDEESAMYMSPQIVDLVGYTSEEWVGDQSFFARVLHPGDRERVLADFAAMHETGEPLECEYRLLARNGTVVWIHDAAVVVRDEAGVPRYAQGYMIDISERKRAEAELRRSQETLQEQMRKTQYQALHDSLTKLANRTLFQDRAGQALRIAHRNESAFAVMLIDLDRFKEINDTLGHASGDRLLCEVAGRLRRALRESDTVARLGGDEFGIVAPQLADGVSAQLLAEKLREEIAQPILVGGLTIEVEASVGIAIYPDHGEDVETLVRHADVSMYVSKNTHTPVVYDADYDHHSRARLALIGELRRAIANGELVVHYQPQAEAGTGEVHMVEALVRWQHPEHGLLGPDQFIPLAEQTGLIRKLTLHVLDTALGQCRAWADEGRSLGVAVNITGRELVDLRFPDEVRRLLLKWGIEPRQLELEVTESTIMADPPSARAVIAELCEIGVSLAIDDFGSGHSSLGYLTQLPISVLKIDKSFVLKMADDPSDAAIVRAAIDLGHNLSLEVIAEGVETEDLKQRLEELGCDTLQGYCVGRPQPAAELDAIGYPVEPRVRPAPALRQLG